MSPQATLPDIGLRVHALTAIRPHPRSGLRSWSVKRAPALSPLLKRSLDLTIALGMLPLALPVMSAAALAVRLTSPGPAIFRQNRVGQGGREFTIYKLRTMCADAPCREGELAETAADRVFFKPQSDTRVTPVGRFLRKYSIDELPQLFNVLRGEMSLVGPRPLLPCDLRRFPTGRYRRRFDVRPGLTGLWQVNGRSLCTDEERLQLDLEYVERGDLGLDLKILLATPRAVITAHGAH